MAASLMIFTGQPKALRKLYSIQPPPRLWGSRRGWPLMMGPGYPIATQSNFQSRTAFLTRRTILLAVVVGPDGILSGSFFPFVVSLMFVPPTSMKRTLRDLGVCRVFVIAPPMGAMNLLPFFEAKGILGSTADSVKRIRSCSGGSKPFLTGPQSSTKRPPHDSASAPAGPIT